MSEEQNIMGMGDQQFNNHVEGLTADEAKAAADSFMHEAVTDPAHPFNARDGKNHRIAVERALRLREQAHSEDPDGIQYNADGEKLVGRVDPAIQKIYDEAMAEQQVKQDKLVKEARKEMDQLVELGYDRDEIADDISPYTVELLKAQRLNATGSKESLIQLTDILNKQAKELKAEPELVQAIASLNAARAVLGEKTPAEFMAITDSVLSIVNRARKAQGHG